MRRNDILIFKIFVYLSIAYCSCSDDKSIKKIKYYSCHFYVSYLQNGLWQNARKKYHIMQNNNVDLKNLCNHESHISLRIWIVSSSLTRGPRYTMLLIMISVVYRKPLVSDGGIVYE